jgi:hypothetical protein
MRPRRPLKRIGDFLSKMMPWHFLPELPAKNVAGRRRRVSYS